MRHLPSCCLVLLGSYFLGDNRCLIVYGVEEVKDEIKVVFYKLKEKLVFMNVYSNLACEPN